MHNQNNINLARFLVIIHVSFIISLLLIVFIIFLPCSFTAVSILHDPVND
jgi:hypothetical protein